MSDTSCPDGGRPDDELTEVLGTRLGRAPHDRLEAAVVLEAWGGLPAEEALAAAAAVASRTDAYPDASHGAAVAVPLDTAPPDRSLVMGDVGFVVGVLFVGFWISSLTGTFGVLAVDRAWRVALPFGLGAQWFLRRRYLAGPDGLGRLRREPGVLALFLACLVPMALVNPGGRLAVELTCIWVGGFVLTRRGWGLQYGVALVAGALVLHAGIPAKVIVAGAAVVAVVGGAVAVGTSPLSDRRPGPWRRALPAGLVGAGMGLLLVVEPRFFWAARGVVPALTVVPSLVGSLWGGLHMTRLWDVLPQVLVGTSVRRRGQTRIGALTSRLLVQSLLRLAVGSAALSSLVLGYLVVTGQSRRIMSTLLLAHAVLAAAGLTVALLEAFGRWAWALTAAFGGVTVALLVELATPGELAPGVLILVGAVVCSILSTPPLVSLLREPDRTIAAAL